MSIIEQYSQPIPKLSKPVDTVTDLATASELRLEINRLINLTESQSRQIRRLQTDLEQLKEYLRKNSR